MSISLRIIDRPEEELHHSPPEGVQPGDMWRVPELDLPDREAWAIVLPNGAGIWVTTQTASEAQVLWNVAGTPPAITVTPSINAEGVWHGHITNGELIG